VELAGFHAVKINISPAIIYAFFVVHVDSEMLNLGLCTIAVFAYSRPRPSPFDGGVLSSVPEDVAYCLNVFGWYKSNRVLHLFALASWIDVLIIGNESGANVLIVLFGLFQFLVEFVITQPDKSKGESGGEDYFLVGVHWLMPSSRKVLGKRRVNPSHRKSLQRLNRPTNSPLLYHDGYQSKC